MAPPVSKKGTNQFQRQGHTASTFGSEPDMTPPGVAGKPVKELKP